MSFFALWPGLGEGGCIAIRHFRNPVQVALLADPKGWGMRDTALYDVGYALVWVSVTRLLHSSSRNMHIYVIVTLSL